MEYTSADSPVCPMHLPFFPMVAPLGALAPFHGTVLILLFAVVLAEAVLKGFALWRAARMGSIGWFIALLVFNTAGILPLVYLCITNRTYAPHRLHKV